MKINIPLPVGQKAAGVVAAYLHQGKSFHY